MATLYGIMNRLAEAGKRGAALLAALALVLTTAQPGWAQNGGGRRRAEPEANPQFQQGLQSSGDAGGGPLGGGPVGGGASSAALESEPAPASSEEAPTPSRNVSGITIGATTSSSSRPAARESSSPLDARVTVRVKGAPLATFLDTISAQAKINFIITEGLETRRVTAFLQNVTVREALQVLLEIKGLTYQQIGKSNTYVVTPRSKTVENVVTRIYTLSYIPLIDLSGTGSDAATGGGSASGGGDGGANAQAGGSSGGGGGNGAQGGISIVNVLNSIISKAGKVAIEPRTNALIVTDIPEVFPQIEQIIAELDKKSPQIIIEAQIVEINSNRSKELGFQWSGQFGKFTAGNRTTSFPMRLPSDLTKTRFLDPIGGAGQSGTGFGAVSNSTLDMTALSVTLSALVKRGEARFLGKPKILTLNNQQALIEITREQAINQGQSLSSGGQLSQASTSVQRKDTGLKLSVTPQVNKDGYITMLLRPEFTSIVPAAVSAVGGVFDPVKRSASTLVRVRNGQTLVLGGLLQSQETKQVSKVPFLGYIPLIGWLFTHVNSTRDNTDLVIFITPTVVSD